MSGPRLLSCQQERGCQESEMTSADQEKVSPSNRDVKRKNRSGRKKTSRHAAGNKKICQDSIMTSASQIKRKWQHQTKMSRIQKCQGPRLPRDHAVDGRASQAVRGRSHRLSLIFIGSSLFRSFRHPACPGSTCNWTFFFHSAAAKELTCNSIWTSKKRNLHKSEQVPCRSYQ